MLLELLIWFNNSVCPILSCVQILMRKFRSEGIILPKIFIWSPIGGIMQMTSTNTAGQWGEHAVVLCVSFTVPSWSGSIYHTSHWALCGTCVKLWEVALVTVLGATRGFQMSCGSSDYGEVRLGVCRCDLLSRHPCWRPGRDTFVPHLSQVFTHETNVFNQHAGSLS